jgi:hypothetical protein
MVPERIILMWGLASERTHMRVLHFAQAYDFIVLPESAVRAKVESVPDSCLNYESGMLGLSGSR